MIFEIAAPHFGLPCSLWIPIAAATVDDIRKYVGRVLRSITDSGSGRVNALLVETAAAPPEEPGVPLWKSPQASQARQRLYPPRQVWVHVDYRGYRQAYGQFGMPAIPAGYFLDHIQNRRAIRQRSYSHPYLRLCPVSRTVNTSGGHAAGGEGMERAFLATHAKTLPQHRMIYADPMDLTKMLDIPPGTQVLDGVRDTQGLFYP
ncbi:MAG: hypothetical protein LBQ32_13005 [Burkholderiaceae bacterium]|jgi:hypothetical protein|nr:hypothetical protein [Burkholderiaceae bacterium]